MLPTTRARLPARNPSPTPPPTRGGGSLFCNGAPMKRGAAPGDIPRWVDYLLVPLVNLVVALLLTGVVVIAIGANPIDALQSLAFGAVGYPEAVGFTLYYAT